MANLTDEQVQKLVQAVQSAEQAVQEAKQAVQGTTQEKSSIVDSVTQNKQEEIGRGEADRHQVFVDSQLWAFDKKLLASNEQSEKVRSIDAANSKESIEIARKQHDFAIQQQLDHIKVISAQNAANFDVALKLEYAKFNAATSHPISPNDEDKDAN
jgi:hypothetical protein